MWAIGARTKRFSSLTQSWPSNLASSFDCLGEREGARRAFLEEQILQDFPRGAMVILFLPVRRVPPAVAVEGRTKAKMKWSRSGRSGTGLRWFEKQYGTLAVTFYPLINF